MVIFLFDSTETRGWYGLCMRYWYRLMMKQTLLWNRLYCWQQLLQLLANIIMLVHNGRLFLWLGLCTYCKCLKFIYGHHRSMEPKSASWIPDNHVKYAALSKLYIFLKTKLSMQTVWPLLCYIEFKNRINFLKCIIQKR